MEPKKYAFVSRDVGPSNLLSLIANHFSSVGHTAMTAFKDAASLEGDVFSEQIRTECADAATVFLGVHAFNNEPEIALINELHARGVAIVIVEDTNRAGFRLDSEAAKDGHYQRISLRRKKNY